MADTDKHLQYPTIVQKFASQLHLRSSISPQVATCYGGSKRPVQYSNAGLQCGAMSSSTTNDMQHSVGSATASPVLFVPSPSEKNFASFATDFLMGGVSAAVSKSAAAPIERVKLLIQNQDELIKAGRLSEPYKGIGDCFARTIKDEGFVSLWRGNTVNVLRYFPTQVLSLSICCCVYLN